MLIRLADAKGHLAHRSLSRFQDWALEYRIYMDRRAEREDEDRWLERQCLNLSPDRWRELYETEEPMTPFGLEEEIPVDDLDEIDAWYRDMDSARTMSGADAADSGVFAGMR